MEQIDENEIIRLIEVKCKKVLEWEETVISHIIDDTGDPSFYCANCEQEHNHTRWTDDGKWTDQDEKHEVRLVGTITIGRLREILEFPLLEQKQKE